MKKSVVFIILLLSFASLFSCSDSVLIAYDIGYDYLMVGHGFTATPHIVWYSDTKPEERKLLFTSSDPSIVSVTDNGVITGNKVGTVTITAKYYKDSSYYDSIEIECVPAITVHNELNGDLELVSWGNTSLYTKLDGMDKIFEKGKSVTVLAKAGSNTITFYYSGGLTPYRTKDPVIITDFSVEARLNSSTVIRE